MIYFFAQLLQPENGGHSLDYLQLILRYRKRSPIGMAARAWEFWSSLSRLLGDRSQSQFCCEYLRVLCDMLKRLTGVSDRSMLSYGGTMLSTGRLSGATFRSR